MQYDVGNKNNSHLHQHKKRHFKNYLKRKQLKIQIYSYLSVKIFRTFVTKILNVGIIKQILLEKIVQETPQKYRYNHLRP